jgi:hypothetical protein
MQHAKFLYLTSTLDGLGGQGHAPAPLPPGNRPGTHCTVGWAPGPVCTCAESFDPPPPPGRGPRAAPPGAGGRLNRKYFNSFYTIWKEAALSLITGASPRFVLRGTRKHLMSDIVQASI